MTLEHFKEAQENLKMIKYCEQVEGFVADFLEKQSAFETPEKMQLMIKNTVTGEGLILDSSIVTMFKNAVSRAKTNYIGKFEKM